MFLPLAFAIALTLPVSPDLPGTDLVNVDFPVNGGPAVGWAGLGVVNRLSNLPMSPEVQAFFDTEFQAVGYFGAFALAKDGGYGYSSGTASLEAARDIALAHCRSVNTSCILVAELVPEGYVAPPPGTVTLSQQIYGYFMNAGKNRDYQALAVSEDGAFSMYWEIGSQAEANRLALDDCEANRERSITGLRDMPCVLVTNLP